MLIYNYDPITTEYTGYSEADLDPAESKAQGKDVYLIPAYATDKKPPKAKANEVVIYDNGWQIKADYRGKYIVNNDMDPYIYDKIGNLPEGYITITEAQANKIREDDLYYVISDGKLIKNPDYDEQKAAREAERVANLQCTKRVFVLMLEQLGLDYFEQIKPAINANRDAELQWELCVQLERKNPLLDQLAAGFGITSKQLDDLFKYANGEITQEEFLNV